MDFDRLETLLASGEADTILICSPHNPAGRVWRPEELRRISEFAMRYRILVLSDEVHGDLAHLPSVHIPFGKIHTGQAWASVHGIGKTFNVSGVHWSFAVVPNEDARRKTRDLLSAWGHYEGSLVGDALATAVLSEGESWLDERLKTIRERLSRARAALSGASATLRASPVEAGFLLWLRDSAYSHDPDLAGRIFSATEVRVLGGERFGAPSGGFFRMNVAVEEPVLEEALERLSTFFRDTRQ